MKMKTLFFICFCLTTATIADTNTSIVPKSNTLTQIDKDAEILRLKKRVEALEKELAVYKKVKPLGSKILVSNKLKTSEKVSEEKKFIFPKEAPEKLTVYYSAAPQSVTDITWQLELNGFTVLAKDSILEGKTVVSFTNEALTDTNSFLSVLHLLVNRDKEVRVQNPSYFAAAFLQDDYTYGEFNATLQALDRALGGMHEVKEKYRYADLSSYHFMIGMPRVKDTIVLATGDDLFSKVKDENASKYIAYTLPLPNGTLLVGHKLKQSTYDYLKKIKAENNAQLFPYNVMISKEKAFMLDPKYYLALSLPLLSMTDFLQIASAPEVIVKDIKEVYK